MPKVQLENTDDLEKCENCGAMVRKGVRFCTACGKPMIQITVPETKSMPEVEEEQSRICPNCGAKLDDGVAFCTECGTKL